MKAEEFSQKLSVITNNEIIKIAKTQLSKLCENSDKNFIMSIPVRLDATDIIYSEIINRLENQINQNKKLIEHLKEIKESTTEGLEEGKSKFQLNSGKNDLDAKFYSGQAHAFARINYILNKSKTNKT